MTAEQVRILEDYDYTGDVTSVLQPGYVVIGDSISNVPTYKFNVGDKIYISVKTGQIKAVDTNVTGRVLLKNQIEYFHYEYHELIYEHIHGWWKRVRRVPALNLRQKRAEILYICNTSRARTVLSADVHSRS